MDFSRSVFRPAEANCGLDTVDFIRSRHSFAFLTRSRSAYTMALQGLGKMASSHIRSIYPIKATPPGLRRIELLLGNPK